MNNETGWCKSVVRGGEYITTTDEGAMKSKTTYDIHTCIIQTFVEK